MSRKGALPNIPLHAAQTQIHTHALIPYDCTFSLIEIFSNMCVPVYLAATCGYILFIIRTFSNRHKTGTLQILLHVPWRGFTCTVECLGMWLFRIKGRDTGEKNNIYYKQLHSSKSPMSWIEPTLPVFHSCSRSLEMTDVVLLYKIRNCAKKQDEYLLSDQNIMSRFLIKIRRMRSD